MADPLSVSASIAGIISLADIVFRYVFRYTRAAAGAKEEIKSLATEMHDLGGVLRNLDALCRSLEAEEQGSNSDNSLRLHCLGQIESTFEKIQKRLKRSTESFDNRSKGRAKEILEQMKWPFSSSETKDLLSRISRYKETLSLAVSTDTLHTIRVCLARQIEHGKKLDDIDRKIDDIQVSAEIPTKILLDKRKRHTLDFFLKPEVNPQNNLDQSISLRHPTTGRWLLTDNTYQEWFETPGSRLWLSGLAGGGKTVLAGAIIQDALSKSVDDDVGVAFFFCDYKNEATHTPVNVLGGIVSQLARQRDDFFELLQSYYDILHPKRGLDKLADPDELRSLICEMAEQLKHLFIIIDGLDECGGSTSDVLEILVELADASDTTSIALLSRDELPIRERLDTFEQGSIEAHTEDLQDYVRAELEERIHTGRLHLQNIELKEEIREELVNRANGMFRWVVCQLDYICEFSTDDDRREAIKELPPTLHETYIRLLKRINSRPQKVREMVRLCLNFIAFFPNELSIQELCQAVSTPNTTEALLSESRIVSERDIARECSSLIRKSANGLSFEFAHFTVQEFLQEFLQDNSQPEVSALASYQLDKPRSNVLMATQCVRFLQLENFNEHVSTVDEWEDVVSLRRKTYPFYKKAAVAWTVLTREGLGDLDLLNAVKLLFHPFKTSYFRSWILCFLFEMANIAERKKLLSGSDIASYLDLEYRLYYRSRGREQARNFKSRFPRIASNAHSVLEGTIKPLHISCALNLPEIVAYIVSMEGKKAVHSKSALGSPIKLAELSLFNFFNAFPILPGNRIAQSFIPVARRRLETIYFLIEAGADLSTLINTPSIFTQVSLIDCHLGIFKSTIELLKAGLVPSADDMQHFERVSRLHKNDRLEDALLEMLHYLKDSSAYDSDWGFQLGKFLWSTALGMNLSFTKNPGLTDTRIALSDESLKSTILAAVVMDDRERLQICLQDGRASKTDDWEGGSLLHHTVKHGALHCAKFLLQRGYDPTCLDTRGLAPMHLRSFSKNIEMLTLFASLNVNLFTQDEKGWNIWHHCAFRGFCDVIFLDLLSKLDLEGGHCGLLVNAEKSRSPLRLCVEEGLHRARHHRKSHRNDPENYEIALLFIDYSDRTPNFWERHGCMFPILAKGRHTRLLKKLIQLQVSPKALDPNQATPLHDLDYDIDMEIVEILKSLYPSAVQQRHESLLPVESYLSRCLDNETPPYFIPDRKLICSLACDSTLALIKETRSSLWAHACSLLKKVIESLSDKRPFFTEDAQIIGKNVIEVLLDLGAMRNYEDELGVSGVEVLFRAVVDSETKFHVDLQRFVSPKTIGAIIQSSRFWDPSSRCAIEFFEVAIMSAHPRIVRVLLDNGLDVHSQLDKISTIEHVFERHKETQLCNTRRGREVLKLLLDHANPGKLKGFGHQGLGILHLIEAEEEKKGLRWLLRQLLQFGVKIDTFEQNASPPTPLLYHIHEGSFFSASLLLELGADPNLTTRSGWNTVVMAASRGAKGILKQLLRSCYGSKVEINWKLRVQMFNPLSNSSEHLATAIHIACLRSHLNCVEFFVGNELIGADCLTANQLTPMHCAAIGNASGVIKYLASAGSDVNSADRWGNTPLHLAARTGALISVETLVGLGALNCVNKDWKFPAMLASDHHYQHVVEYLDKRFQKEDSPDKDRSTPDQLQAETLLYQLGVAIHHSDLRKCEDLVSTGCQLNTAMPRFRRFLPLQYALELNQVQIVELFLQHGTSVLGPAQASQVNHTLRDMGICTTVDIFSSKERLNPVLRRILNKYCEQGGDFVHGNALPFHAAMMANNTESMKIVLEFLKENAKRIGRRSQIAPEDVISKVVNRPFLFSQDDRLTPLHIAAQTADMETMLLLLDNGAEVDVLDTHYQSPLDFASSTPAAKLLADRGASLTPRMMVQRLDIDETVMMQLQAVLTGNPTKPSTAVLNHILKSLASVSHDWRTTTPHTWELLANFETLQIPIAGTRWGETTVTNVLLGSSLKQDYLLNRPHFFNNIEPFNWYETWLLTIPSFLSSSFHRYKRLLSPARLKYLANLEPEKGWSPLCRAATMGLLDVLANCITLGASVDFEGSPHGSALMVASLCGRLDAVSLLVRSRAAVSYQGRDGWMNALSVARSKAVRDFLLVGQFKEQKQILQRSDETEDKGYGVKPWSGAAQARHLLEVGALTPDESLLKIAARLSYLRRWMRGKIAFVIDDLEYSRKNGVPVLIRYSAPQLRRRTTNLYHS